jgi:glycosyltransferase involved in cell wall biosynthesis
VRETPGAVIRARRHLRVLVVIDGLGLGGAESLLLPYAAAAPSAELEVEVCCLAPEHGWRHEMIGPLRAAGVPLHFMDMRRLLEPRLLPRLASIVRRTRPDIVHAHLEDAITLAPPAARLHGVPTVGTFHHNTRSLPRREATRERLAVEVGARAARTIFVSRASMDVWAARYGRRRNWTVVHNGVQVGPRVTTPLTWPPELGIPEGALVAVLAASMRGGKGHEAAIAAWPAVRAACPEAILLLAGSGALESELRAQADALGVGHAVRFAGFRTDVPRLLAASTLALLPSEAEAFPTTLLEAAAAGRPAVATPVGGIPEIVDDGRTGRLVPPGDVAALARAVTCLLVDEGRREQLGRAARRRAEQEFSVERWVARLRRVYDEVVQDW